MFRRVTVIGVGLMGGSLALALRKNGLTKEIFGVSQRHSSLVTAMKNGVIDNGFTDPVKAVQGSDLVVFACPVQTIMRFLPSVNKALRRGCILTDVGSTKVEIVEEAEKILSAPGNFVGSHPLAGSEKRGIDHAVDNLYENTICIMTPTEKTNRVAKEKIKHMWSKIGAHVKFLAPEEHDRILSNISHLPHLLSFVLMNVVPEGDMQFAAQGFRDVTRVAASSPQMWVDIFLSNKKNVLNALDSTVSQFSELRKAIIKNDEKTLLEYITKAKEKRDAINQ
jgi:prephenate dehydrogenase